MGKITVAALVREGEINKGTFYLHYADIYALYDEVLEETVAHIVDKVDPYSLFLADPPRSSYASSSLFPRRRPPKRSWPC